MSEQPTGAGGAGAGKDARGAALPAMAGDGWVNCSQGHGHWGRFGAAGLLPVHRGEDGQVYVLMHHRGADTDQGDTWSLLGGARDSHESVVQAALREAVEESDLDPAGLRVERVIRDDHGGWSYDTVIASAERRMPVQPIDGESVALAWVPAADVSGLNLHPGFGASWPRVRTELEAVFNGTAAASPVESAASLPRLPAHPVTGAHVVLAAPLHHGDHITRRALVTFADGTRSIYEEYARAEDAMRRVLDSHVGRAVGARVGLSLPVGTGRVYTDHMPGEPASARHNSLAALADQGAAATRDGVFLGLYHALAATHGLGVGHLVVGQRESLIVVEDGTVTHGELPDPTNPFVSTFFRQLEPHVFAWVDNPVPPEDIEVMGRHLDSLRPLFDHLGRPALHDAVMERFGQVAEHATGSAPLLPRSPSAPVTLPTPAPSRHDPLPPPLGPQERAEYQRIGEQLLTNDGQITDTPQAKTIAIQAIAERMRSSTPELVLASMGLNVGNDMADRLGDSRYMLVPHNPRYPSMGASVLQRDELDPANPRHSLDQVVPMDTPQADTLIRMIAVSDLMGSWAYGSNNNVRVLALQEAAREEFGLTGVLEWRLDPSQRAAVDLELDYNRDALRDFLRTQYEMTQEALTARGVTEVLSYRALSWPEGADQPDWAGLTVGDTFEARQRPLASWSADREIVADWLQQRGGSGVILVSRTPAHDVLAIPMTGIGYFGQKEWVLLPGDSQVTLDGFSHGQPPTTSIEHTAASGIMLGAPALDGTAQADAQQQTHSLAPAIPEPATRWRPLRITDPLDPADQLDSQIIRALDGQEDFPSWWPRDDSGYAITKRDLDFLGINPIQIKWLVTGEAPMGMTPELYQQFRMEMLQALQRDGIGAGDVDIRLKGTGADFFSGIHKTVPREEDLPAGQASQRLREWLGDSQDRPVRRPYDLMWRLSAETEPSDFDLDINSTAIVRAARDHWNAHYADRYPGDFMGGHGYLEKQTVKETLPALAAWAGKWEESLGRPISLGVFESSGPFDATQLGRPLSSHFRATDWIIHRPGTQPYSSSEDATQAAQTVTAHFRTWVGTSMGQELADSAHPRVAAFRDAWRQLPPHDAGPAAAFGRYAEVAERAKALASAARGSARFTPGDVQALRALADSADQHSGRLAATLPPDSQQIRRTTAAATPPAVAAPAPPTARTPRASA
ncbi:NUDIX domain-containing protein [Streptomyces sp. NPDC005180]|uniref:NUDIX domain-containing protein n=1 Tax=Streptomyces sp. NPDC005180 TaxID=3156868 RepID=UPI0033AC58EE